MLLLLTTSIVLSVVLADAQPATIPLDQIWALDMPGTKNVRKLQDIPLGLPNDELLRQSLVRQIEVALHRRNLPQAGEPPRPILVVKGSGLDALREAARIFKEMNELKTQKEAELLQPLDSEISLVFYSYLCGHYVHLTEVERLKNVITVKYRFVTHTTANMSTHFAIIPLGKNMRGTVKVKVIQEPSVDCDGDVTKTSPISRTLICDSMSFRTQ